MGGFCKLYVVMNVLLRNFYRPGEILLLVVFTSGIFEGFLCICKHTKGICVFVKEDEMIVLLDLK